MGNEKNKYITFANEVLFFGINRNTSVTWNRELLKLLSKEDSKYVQNLIRLVGYIGLNGPSENNSIHKDIMSVGNIVSWADIREPKKGEHDSPWPYIFDHEFLYLSRNHREKVAHAKFRERLDSEGKFQSDWYDDSRGRLVDFGLSPWDVVNVIRLQLESNVPILKPLNEFYIGRNYHSKYSDKFRIKVYYQKPTPKRYPMGSVGIYVEENPAPFDTWHNSLHGNTRVFFSAGKAELRQKTRETVPMQDRHLVAKILSSDAV